MLAIGINEGFGSSVVVSEDGVIRFAIQDERVNRVKNASGFPHDALRFTLDHLEIAPSDVDVVCFSNLLSPVVTKPGLLRWYDTNAALGLGEAIRHDRPLRLSPQVWRARRAERRHRQVANSVIEHHLDGYGLGNVRVLRTHHHLNHAAAAYFGLREDHAETYLVLTLDGGGDGDCAHVYRASEGTLSLLAATPEGHSIGNVYSRVTHLMGMTPHEHEYKLMGLAPYADEDYVTPLLERFRSYLDLDPGNPLVFRRRVPESTLLIEPRLARDFTRARFDSLAGAVQVATEELVVRWVREAVSATGIRRVLAAGGVFMNVKLNKLISELDEIESFDVFPSCGDESLPFGGVWLEHAGRSDSRGADLGLRDYYLGPEASHDLAAARARYAADVELTELDDPEATAADLLAAGEIVAVCSGRMEFGARALGNRSILADPGRYEVVPAINKMIKQRDFWMPFAPAVQIEHADDFLHVPSTLPAGRISPYMMHSFDTTERRSECPAALHPYDATARAQVVAEEQNPRFHRLIGEFAARTGKSIVLNTSFNLHGFPIAMGACDAIDVMLNSSIRHLLVDRTLIRKRPAD